MTEKLVNMYMQDWLPSADGTGTNNRIFSNLRAYLDLGFRAEVVCFRVKDGLNLEPMNDIENVQWTFIKPDRSGRLSDRLSYVGNLNLERSLNYRFKTRRTIKTAVEKRIAKDPGALHHFEYLDTACAYINYKKCQAIWSMHDLESQFASAHQKIRAELTNGKVHSWEDRAAYYLQLAERKAAEQSHLTLCIAKHEQEFLRRNWNCTQAEYFPMSLPNEEVPPRKDMPRENRKVRLLHLGRVDSLPSYRSLEFLFTEVFPILPDRLRDQIELRIVGECRESQKTLRIKELASKYSFVEFAGFQEDLRGEYAKADLQLVGSTEATGLRTRIIESFAYEVPVLSTSVGAEGVDGMRDGHNIYLADTADKFCSILQEVMDSPERLRNMAVSGRILYDEMYSRRAVAETLGEVLEKYQLIS